MVSIFIRTYHKDLIWLEHSLRSIHKNLKGWGEIVICIPTGQEFLISSLTQEKIVTSKIYKDDYLGQQISKFKSHEYCNGEYILFVDSDVIFKPKANVLDYFYENKPIILKQKYENVGEAICWKKPTEKLFKEQIDYEYMRRAPQLFHKSTLEKLNDNFPDLENYIINQPYRQFSEFNVLGFYAEKMENDSYSIIEVTNGIPDYLPENKSVQKWSWGGITADIKKEFENYLK